MVVEHQPEALHSKVADLSRQFPQGAGAIALAQNDRFAGFSRSLLKPPAARGPVMSALKLRPSAQLPQAQILKSAHYLYFGCAT